MYRNYRLLLNMLTQRLAKSDIKVSALGWSCLPIGGPWTHNSEYFHNGEVNDDESIRAIYKALELGINFFDTAANYGAVQSKRSLGKAITEQNSPLGQFHYYSPCFAFIYLSQPQSYTFFTEYRY
jgi:predicted aldo/keto reductase-like oxidoreductase